MTAEAKRDGERFIQEIRRRKLEEMEMQMYESEEETEDEYADDDDDDQGVLEAPQKHVSTKQGSFVCP
jgi:DNA-binding TFAR19-related protein (PDSD5 family)